MYTDEIFQHLIDNNFHLSQTQINDIVKFSPQVSRIVYREKGLVTIGTNENRNFDVFIKQM